MEVSHIKFSTGSFEPVIPRDKINQVREWKIISFPLRADTLGTKLFSSGCRDMREQLSQIWVGIERKVTSLYPLRLDPAVVCCVFFFCNNI